jgi:hypothetical protein
MSINKEGKLRIPIIKWLESFNMTPVFEVYVNSGVADIVGVEFYPKIGRLIPKIKKMCIIELKLDDAADVIRQAKNNLCHCKSSFAAMPIDRINKFRPGTLQKFKDAGVGLLSIETFSAPYIYETVVKVEFGDVNFFCDEYHPFRKKLYRRKDEWEQRILTKV